MAVRFNWSKSSQWHFSTLAPLSSRFISQSKRSPRLQRPRPFQRLFRLLSCLSEFSYPLQGSDLRQVKFHLTKTSNEMKPSQFSHCHWLFETSSCIALRLMKKYYVMTKQVCSVDLLLFVVAYRHSFLCPYQIRKPLPPSTCSMQLQNVSRNLRASGIERRKLCFVLKIRIVKKILRRNKFFLEHKKKWVAEQQQCSDVIFTHFSFFFHSMRLKENWLGPQVVCVCVTFL